jgi:hypothetical protein
VAEEEDRTTMMQEQCQKLAKTESASSPTRPTSRKDLSILIRSCSNSATRISCSSRGKITKDPFPVTADVTNCKLCESKEKTRVKESPKMLIMFLNNE